MDIIGISLCVFVCLSIVTYQNRLQKQRLLYSGKKLLCLYQEREKYKNKSDSCYRLRSGGEGLLSCLPDCRSSGYPRASCGCNEPPSFLGRKQDRAAQIAAPTPVRSDRGGGSNCLVLQPGTIHTRVSSGGWFTHPLLTTDGHHRCDHFL